jgi:putative acetyltransferase
MNIRAEQPGDIDPIRAVNDAAFGGTGEGRLVDALRRAGKLTVSLVAEVDGDIVGHIAFSPVTCAAAANGFGLAPLAVRPDVQRSGVGKELARAGLTAMRRVGADFVVVLGDPKYYAKFGFAPARRWGMTDEYDGGEAFQAIELREGCLAPDVGLVRYAAEFSMLA